MVMDTTVLKVTAALALLTTYSEQAPKLLMPSGQIIAKDAYTNVFNPYSK